MSAANQPPESVPQVFRGKCRNCGSKFVVVAYGHKCTYWQIANEVASACPMRLPEGQQPLDVVAESESDDEAIPF